MFGCLIGIVGSIVSGISAACSAVAATAATVLQAVGPVLSNWAHIVGEGLKNLLKPETLNMIGEIAKCIGKIAEIITGPKEVDEIGAKALQENDKKPEDFDSTEAYIDYLKNEVQLDKEKFDKMGEQEKLVCTATGSALVLDASEKKLNESHLSEFAIAAGKAGVSVAEVMSLFDTVSKDGKLSFSDLVDYLNNKTLDNSKYDTVFEVLKDNINDKTVRAELSKYIQNPTS